MPAHSTLVLATRAPALLVLAACLLPFSAPRAAAQPITTVTVLHTFSTPGANGDNDDGQYAYDVIAASNGNFYGTAIEGGTNGSGTVFQITPTGVLTTLHTFSPLVKTTELYGDGHNNDGGYPYASLIEDADGNFFGTTASGGVNGSGTIFKITPAGVLTNLHNFGAFTTGGKNSDGWTPERLVRGSDGNFYGTTAQGGLNGSGTVFKVAPTGGFTLLYTFGDTSESSTNPGAPNDLTAGSDGNLYGETSYGGANGTGTIFKMTPDGILTILHAFPAYTAEANQSPVANTGGASPTGALTQGGDGNFYGATDNGGPAGTGTIFKMTPDGVVTTLHNFSTGVGDPGINADGGSPTGYLTQGSDGNFYGAAAVGGGNGNGVLFRLTPSGGYTNLYAFGSLTDPAGGGDPVNTDGALPESPLALGSDGSFYGTTRDGGAGASGTIFKFTPGVPLPSFFDGETALSNGVYYLSFSSGNYFGYYSFLADPHYLYHFDLGYEYVFDAADGHSGVYLYDFKSNGFFYTSPVFPFPYLYDFTLDTVLYYYPDPSNPGHYNTDGYRFDNGQIIVK